MVFPKRPHDFEVGFYFINNSRVDGLIFLMVRLTSRGKMRKKKRGLRQKRGILGEGKSKSLNRFCRKGSFGDSSPDKTPRSLPGNCNRPFVKDDFFPNSSPQKTKKEQVSQGAFFTGTS